MPKHSICPAAAVTAQQKAGLPAPGPLYALGVLFFCRTQLLILATAATTTAPATGGTGGTSTTAVT
jgi:hypothetical protein